MESLLGLFLSSVSNTMENRVDRLFLQHDQAGLSTGLRSVADQQPGEGCSTVNSESRELGGLVLLPLSS